MTRRSLLIAVLQILPVALSLAQEPDAAILMTVGGIKIENGEFIRMYRKSNEPGKTMTPDEYLPQFILFKQKVADAVSEGYDTTKSFREELGRYRDQLAQNYLTDNLRFQHNVFKVIAPL